MIVVVSMKTLSAREPDHSASRNPIEITAAWPRESTSSIVGSITLVDDIRGQNPARQVQQLLAKSRNGSDIQRARDESDGTGEPEDQRRQGRGLRRRRPQRQVQ